MSAPVIKYRDDEVLSKYNRTDHAVLMYLVDEAIDNLEKNPSRIGKYGLGILAVLKQIKEADKEAMP